jgi:hypothetical protein
VCFCERRNAATVHHAKPRHHLIVRPSQGVTPGFAVPAWTDDATRRWLDNASSVVTGLSDGSVCTENLIQVDGAMESLKLAE